MFGFVFFPNEHCFFAEQTYRRSFGAVQDMETEPHQPTEQEVYDLLANLELAGLPSALIVTGLSPEVFKNDQARVMVDI